LVVGAGAMGLSFVDTLLAEQPNASVLILDSRSRPGGHWVDSYSFVRLHQPAAWYGVASEKLEHDGDPRELTPGPKVQEYFQRVLDKLVASGQVKYFPNCWYDRKSETPAAGEAHSFALMDGSASYSVCVNRKLVDAAYLTAITPSTSPPPFKCSESARVVGVAEIADLAALEPTPKNFVVVGAGKTGIDAVVHLLAGGVDQSNIKWIVPNDAVLLNRDALIFDADPELRTFDSIPGFDAHPDLKPVAKHTLPICFLDETVPVRNFRCATVGNAELAQIRKVKQVIRQGRVVSATGDAVELERGRVDLEEGTLLVNCTGDGLRHQAGTPIFAGDKITLQCVRVCQQTFSAAAIAHVEGLECDEAKKNELCRPVPHPQLIEDYVLAHKTTEENMHKFRTELGDWLQNCRLLKDNHNLRNKRTGAGAPSQKQLSQGRYSLNQVEKPQRSEIAQSDDQVQKLFAQAWDELDGDKEALISKFGLDAAAWTDGTDKEMFLRIFT